jgi:hypothetical protein
MCGARKEMAAWLFDGSDPKDGSVEVFGKGWYVIQSVRRDG